MGDEQESELMKMLMSLGDKIDLMKNDVDELKAARQVMGHKEGSAEEKEHTVHAKRENATVTDDEVVEEEKPVYRRVTPTKQLNHKGVQKDAKGFPIDKHNMAGTEFMVEDRARSAGFYSTLMGKWEDLPDDPVTVQIMELAASTFITNCIEASEDAVKNVITGTGEIGLHPSEKWALIKKAFAGYKSADIAKLHGKLTTIQGSDFGSITEYIDEFEQLHMRFKVLKGKIDMSVLRQKFLGGLETEPSFLFFINEHQTYPARIPAVEELIEAAREVNAQKESRRALKASTEASKGSAFAATQQGTSKVPKCNKCGLFHQPFLPKCPQLYHGGRGGAGRGGRGRWGNGGRGRGGRGGNGGRGGGDKSGDKSEPRKCHRCNSEDHVVKKCPHPYVKTGNAANFAEEEALYAQGKSQDWNPDTGATNHFTNDRSKFVKIQPKNGWVQTAAKAHGMSIKGTGMTHDGIQAFHCPDSVASLLSMSKLADNDEFSVFTKEKVYTLRRTKVTIPADGKLRVEGVVVRQGDRVKGKGWTIPARAPPEEVDRSNPYAHLAQEEDDEEDGDDDGYSECKESENESENESESNIASEMSGSSADANKPTKPCLSSVGAATGRVAACPPVAGEHSDQPVKSETLQEAHHRLGHISIPRLQAGVKAGCMKGIQISSGGKKQGDERCEECLIGKMRRAPFKPRTRNRAQKQKRGKRRKTGGENDGGGKSEQPVEEEKVGAFQSVHLDIQGKINPPALDGSVNRFVFVDKGTGVVASYATKKKSDAISVVDKFIQEYGKPVELSVKTLFTDNDGAFDSDEFRKHCDKLGIVQRFTVAGSSQQNGAAERAIGVTAEGARAQMANYGGMKKNLWGESSKYFTHIHNAVPPAHTPAGQVPTTPYEKLNGSAPDVRHFKAFGCPVIYYVNPKRETQGHMDDRGKKGRFVGVCTERKAYRVLKADTGKVVTMRIEDVVFLPPSANKKKKKKKKVRIVDLAGDSAGDSSSSSSDSSGSDADSSSDDGDGSSSSGSSSDSGDSSSDSGSSSGDDGGDVEPAAPAAPRRSGRARVASRKVREVASGDAACMVGDFGDGLVGDDDNDVKVPTDYAYWGDTGPEGFPELNDHPTHEEVKQLDEPERALWNQAIATELEAHVINETWEVIPPEEVDPRTGMPFGAKERGAKKVRPMWVLRIKRHPDGSVKQRKARIVAREFKDSGAQREKRQQRVNSNQRGTGDFDDSVDVHAPVAAKESLRVLMALAAAKEWMIYQLDVKTAYVNAVLDREVYMNAPEGMEVPDGTVLRLKKCLYGLRTSGNRWNTLLNQNLEDMGYVRTNSDPCVYVRREGEESTSMIALIVDDLMIATRRKSEYQRVLGEMESKYRMTDEGLLAHYAGMEVHQQPGDITVCQKRYTVAVLEKFRMGNSNPVATPDDSRVNLSEFECPQGEEEQLAMKNIPYRSVFGAVLYLAVSTRPDLAEAIGKLGQFLANPCMAHWKGLKRVLRYMNGSRDRGVRYTNEGEQPDILYGYSDADYADCVATRRSVSGMTLFLANGPVVWASRKQRCVTLSTMEAEYVALSQAAVEVLWLRNLLKELGVEQVEPTRLLGDNEAANLLTKRPGVPRKAKHIDIRYHHVKECVARGQIAVEYVASEFNIADMFTKALPKPRFEVLRSSVTVRVPDQEERE